ncbi:MAG: hypothetical protein ACE5JR_08250 [Gemmatimonadota bacterium]
MSKAPRFRSLSSVAYLVTLTLVTVAAAGLSRLLDSSALAVSAGVLALYGLHLLSIRTLVRRQQDRKEERSFLRKRPTRMRERRTVSQLRGPPARGISATRRWNMESEQLDSELHAVDRAFGRCLGVFRRKPCRLPWKEPGSLFRFAIGRAAPLRPMSSPRASVSS